MCLCLTLSVGTTLWGAEITQPQKTGGARCDRIRLRMSLMQSLIKIELRRGAWVAQSVKRPTSARSRSRGLGVRAPRQALG